MQQVLKREWLVLIVKGKKVENRKNLFLLMRKKKEKRRRKKFMLKIMKR